MSKKLLGLIAGLAIALSVMVVPVVHGEDAINLDDMSNEQLIAYIQSLLQGGTTTTTTPTTTTPTTGSSNWVSLGIPAGFQFSKNLSQGMTGNDVKYLQIVLNSDSATAVATTGAGSKGNESSYFGGLTKTAVAKFQTKYASSVLTPLGLTKGTGFVGTTTRAKLNELLAQGGTTPTDVSSLTAVQCVTQGYAWNGTVCSDPKAGQVDVSTLSALDCVTRGYAWNGTKCYDPNAGTTTPTTPVVTPVTGAGLTVALSSDSPANSTLITGQSAAPIAKFVITNKDSVEAKVTKVELQRIGVSADATLSNVYLFNGATRLTDAVSVSQGKITFNNPNGIITIPAGNSVILTVASDIAISTEGQIVGASLTGVTSNVEVKSTLPIQGGTHTIAKATLSTITATKVSLGTSTDPQEDVNVWQANIAVSEREVKMSKLALKQLNSIESSDIQNFRLYIDGEEVAQVDSLDSNNVVTFTFNKTVKSGTRTFKVLADVVGGSSRVIQMSLRNAADISAIDSEYNVTAPVYTSGTSFSPVTANAITVNEGTVTVKKSSSSATGSVARNSSGVSLAKYELKTYGETIKVDTLTVSVADNQSGVTTTLKNGKIFIDGVQYGSSASITEAGTQFNVNYVAQAGKTAIIEVVADLQDLDATVTSLNVSLVKEGSENAQAQVSYKTVFVPGSEIKGNSLAVSDATISLAKASNYRSQNVVFPQSNYKIGEWILTGDATQDVNLYTLVINPTILNKTTSGKTDTEIVSIRDAYLKIDGEETGIKSSLSGATSWSVNKLLPKNGSIRIELYGNVEIVSGTLGVAATGDQDASVKGALKVTGSGAVSGTNISIPSASTYIDGQTVTYAPASIKLAKGASSPTTSILPDEGTIQTVSYQIEAVNDAYTIDTFTVTFGADAATVISEVRLMDGSTVLQSKAGGTTSVSFAGLNYQVPANTKKTLDIAVVLSSVGTGAGVTGADIKTTFDASETKIAPLSTGAVVAFGGSDISGNSLYVYKSIPTVSLVSLPDTKLTAGTKALSKFEVKANQSGSIAFANISFEVKNTDNVAVTNFKLYDANNNKIADCADPSSNVVVCALTTEEEIAANGSKIYELRADVDAAPTKTLKDGYVTAKILGDEGYVASTKSDAVITKSGSTAAKFIWSDMSAQNHATGGTGSSDWANGYLVKNLPTSTQTIQD